MYFFSFTGSDPITGICRRDTDVDLCFLAHRFGLLFYANQTREGFVRLKKVVYFKAYFTAFKNNHIARPQERSLPHNKKNRLEELYYVCVSR